MQGAYMIPDYLINEGGLSSEAIAALVWIKAQPENYTFRINDVKKRFGWGNFLWRRISNELKERGILKFGYFDGCLGLTLSEESNW